jgi:hypothetical protein
MPASRSGAATYWKSEYFDALPEAADETLIAHARAIASPHSAVLCMHLGGAADGLRKHAPGTSCAALALGNG